MLEKNTSWIIFGGAEDPIHYFEMINRRKELRIYPAIPTGSVLQSNQITVISFFLELF